jgi:WD40 repeat protein
MDFLQASKQKKDEEIADQERQQRADIERAQRELEQAQALAEAQQERAEAEKRRAMEEERRANAERQKAEESLRRIEEQTKAASRLRRLVVALVLMSVIAFAVAAAALYLWGEARIAKQKAEGLAKNLESSVKTLESKNRELDEEKRRAESLQRDALEQAQIAKKKESEANMERKRAEDAAIDAKKAREQAEERRKESVIAATEAQKAREQAESDRENAKKAEEEVKKQFGLLQIEKKKSETQEKIKNSRLLARTAADELAYPSNPTRSVLLAIYAIRSISKLVDEGATEFKPEDFKDGLEALQQSIQMSFLRQSYMEVARNLVGHVESVAFTTEGKIVSAGRFGSMKAAPTVIIRDRSPEINSELNNEGMVANSTTSQRFTLAPDTNRRVNSIAVSPDGAYFAIGQDDGKIKALDISSEGRSVIETRAHRHPINLINLSNRRTHATIGQQTLMANASVFWSSSVTDLNRQKADRLWRKPTIAGWGRIIFGMARSNHLVRAINFSQDGNLVAIARQDGVIELRDSKKDGRIYLKWVSDDNEPVLGLAFSPLYGRGADRLATVTRTGIKIWDISQLKKRKYGMFEDRNDDSPKRVSETVFWSDIGDATGVVAYSPDGRLIATTTNNGAVMIWDVSEEDGAATGPLVTLNQPRGRITNLTFNPYFKSGESTYQLATVSADDLTTKLWELHDLQKLRDLQRLVKSLKNLAGETDKHYIETLLKEAESFLPAKRRRLTESEFNNYVKPLESGER